MSAKSSAFKERFGIIGNGVVGSAMVRTWQEYVGRINTYDLDTRRSSVGTLSELYTQSDFIFICTPESQVSSTVHSLNTLKLQNISREKIYDYPTTDIISIYNHNKLIVVRSTTPIGVISNLSKNYPHLEICHYPEFLTQRCSYSDSANPTRNIIGVFNPSVISPMVEELLDILAFRFPGIATLVVSSDESEAIKLFTNAFFALKVSFFNEIGNIAECLGLDKRNILSGILSDGRISPSHTRVPGPDNKYGFGGKCLPKDLDTLISIAESLYSLKESATLLKAVRSRNIYDHSK